MLNFVLYVEYVVFLSFIVTGEPVDRVLELNGDYRKNITLPCFNDSPDKIIKWEKPGKEKKQVLWNGDLFLYNLQKRDSGVYKCSVDREDRVLSTILLNVKTPPAALENVTVIPWTVLALIRWNLKDDGGYPIINITVRYKDATKEEKWRYVNQHLVSLTRTQAEIYKLDPNSTYLFQVWATNKLGCGEVTNITAKTLHDNQEIELARHLLEGAETFDARVWLAAVAIVMTTLIILTVGTCCILYRDCHISLRSRRNEDLEHIELIPNVIPNPCYYEEMLWLSNHHNTNDSLEDGEDFMIYFASRNDAKAIRV